jgi:SSS family solute:Na+ symporter
VFVVFLPLEFAINLQLLGGIWMLQTFPAVVFGLFTRWFRPLPLLAGWAGGMALGTTLSWMQGVKPVFVVPGIGALYIGLIALAVNIVVAALGTLMASAMKAPRTADATLPADYRDLAPAVTDPR